MARRFTALSAGIAIAALISAAAILVSPPAMATLGPGMNEKPNRTWMTNGIVYASTLSEDGKTLYIGAKFSSVREKPPGTPGKTLAVSNVAALDAATGAPVSTWKPNVAGDAEIVPEVRALTAKNGKVYIGGKFASANGQPRRHLAAVDATTSATPGALDTRHARDFHLHRLHARGDQHQALHRREVR